jgi:hypothetical protein
MERNWDTIREVLFRLEAMAPEKGFLQLADFPKERAYEYSYNVELMAEAGLIYCKMSKTFGKNATDFSAYRLTWEGHEFLDAIRSDTVWNKAKSSFVKGGLSMTFDLAKSVASDIAASILKSTIGS